MNITSVNPLNNKKIKEYKCLTDSEIEKLLQISDEVFSEWKKTSINSRVQVLKNVAEILREQKEDIAALITLEMGKPIRQSRSELDKCAWVCDYYADNAKFFLVDEPILTDASNSFISYEPIGTVLAVMPWNFPFWQVLRFAAPALIAGNTCLLKHASSVTGCAIRIQEIFIAAGLPEGAFTSLIIKSDKVAGLLADSRVRAVTLTGSEAAGSSVASIAGKYIKKSVLELGGSDPFIVLDDANLKKAAAMAVQSRMLNNGQSCISAKRFIIMENILSTFTELLIEEFSKLKVGDPSKEDTDIGPLAREDLRDELQKQVDRSIELGAQVLFQGTVKRKTGAFFAPVLLGSVRPGMPAFDEELFGPVASIITARDSKEAIELANQSDFGLGASVWTEDIDKGSRMARHIQAGNVFVNSLVKSDPRLPFGGIKKSGYGRELSHYAVKEFVNVKTIWIE